MSECDNLFDLDDFIKKNGTKEIKKTWKDFRKWHIDCESAYCDLKRIVDSKETIDNVIKKNIGI